MHRQEHNAFSDVIYYPCSYTRLSPFIFNGHDVALFDTPYSSVFGVDLKERAIYVLAQLVHLPGFCHGMPLIANATRCQYEGIARIGDNRYFIFGWWQIRKSCPPVRRIKPAIRKQSGCPRIDRKSTR